MESGGVRDQTMGNLCGLNLEQHLQLLPRGVLSVSLCVYLLNGLLHHYCTGFKFTGKLLSQVREELMLCTAVTSSAFISHPPWLGRWLHSFPELGC